MQQCLRQIPAWPRPEFAPESVHQTGSTPQNLYCMASSDRARECTQQQATQGASEQIRSTFTPLCSQLHAMLRTPTVSMEMLKAHRLIGPSHRTKLSTPRPSRTARWIPPSGWSPLGDLPRPTLGRLLDCGVLDRRQLFGSEVVCSATVGCRRS